MGTNNDDLADAVKWAKHFLDGDSCLHNGELETLIRAAQELAETKNMLDLNAQHIGDLMDVHRENERLQAEIDTANKKLASICVGNEFDWHGVKK